MIPIFDKGRSKISLHKPNIDAFRRPTSISCRTTSGRKKDFSYSRLFIYNFELRPASFWENLFGWIGFDIVYHKKMTY